MRRYYHTISDFVINEDGRNTLIIPSIDGSYQLFELTVERENAEMNAYLGQWPGMDISEEEFNEQLELAKIEAVKRAKEAKKLIESIYPPIDRIPF